MRSKRAEYSEADTDAIVRSAWRSLPSEHRALLESVGASQWKVVHGPLGAAVEDLLQSVGRHSLGRNVRRGLDRAVGLWVRELRLILINDRHPKLAGLDAGTMEEFIARVAWHEWGHALSVARCSADDIAAGARLLELAPAGNRERIRAADYSRTDYTHEVIAETYALLMVRRLQGESRQPSWLHDEIYDLLIRATGWSG